MDSSNDVVAIERYLCYLWWQHSWHYTVSDSISIPMIVLVAVVSIIPMIAAIHVFVSCMAALNVDRTLSCGVPTGSPEARRKV